MNASSRNSSETRSPLEIAVLVHLGIFIVGTAWAFGGMSPGARTAVQAWGTLGMLLFGFGCVAAARRTGTSLWHVTRELWPLAVFDLLAIASAFNPTFRPVLFDGETVLQFTEPAFSWLPVSTRPSLTLQELWLFNGVVLSGFNAYLVLRRRRMLRLLLGVVALNALLLSILGTVQKLSGSDGLYFGAVESPQLRFFATFVYHNHWGAFTVLNVAACIGLLFHTLSRPVARDVWHSPAPAGAVAILLLAATAPLSGSRSATILLAVLLVIALGQFTFQLVAARRAQRASSSPALAAVLATVLLALGSIGFLAGDMIAERYGDTVEQVERMREQVSLGSRATLYSDTWRMASEHPWFGWGLESFADVFSIYNSQRADELWFRPVYQDAHSDWLQSIAESGFVGTGLLILLGILPFRGSSLLRSSAVPRYLIVGCTLILLYALIEFPLANTSVLLGFWTALFAAARHAKCDARRNPVPGAASSTTGER